MWCVAKAGTVLRVFACGVHQATAKAAEDEVAAVRKAMQEEQEQLRAQVEESSTVVGQWSEAYQSLQAQYEAAQVGEAGPFLERTLIGPVPGKNGFHSIGAKFPEFST